jgi:hypothetical protein
MCEMRFSLTGRRHGDERPVALAQSMPLTTIRVSTAEPRDTRSLGRREVEFSFARLFVPSLIVDHTELLLRQAGTHAEEGFVIWAGSLAGGDAYISSVVIPKMDLGDVHGQISAETTADLLNGLDARDLVPVAQLHTHPRDAFLSDIDSERPVIAVPGFLSIVIPAFGFVDLTDVGSWSAHEFLGAGRWSELTEQDRRQRFIIDESIIRVDR